jgi:hypothetical protein
MMLHADKRKHERKHFSENGTRCWSKETWT